MGAGKCLIFPNPDVDRYVLNADLNFYTESFSLMNNSRKAKRNDSVLPRGSPTPNTWRCSINTGDDIITFE